SPLEMTDRGLRDVRCNDQPFVVRRAENPHVGVPRDLQAPKQTGPSILRERNDGGAVFELDRLDADAPGRVFAALLPQVFVQHVVDEDPVRLEMLLHVLADRLDGPRRSIRAAGSPRLTKGHHHDSFFLLLAHGLTPSARDRRARCARVVPAPPASGSAAGSSAVGPGPVRGTAAPPRPAPESVGARRASSGESPRVRRRPSPSRQAPPAYLASSGFF